MDALQQHNLLRFADYLEREKKPKEIPAHWPATQLAACLADVEPLQRGALALVSNRAAPGAEIAPGISMTVQTLRPGQGTAPHSHSFWHIYIVTSGRGHVYLGADQDKQALAPNDVLYLPPWSEHRFECDTAEDLILYTLQNLPQLAALGALVRQEPDSDMTVMFKTPPAVVRKSQTTDITDHSTALSDS